MIRFECDYCEGAHPAVLQLLMETNLEQTRGYGADPYSQQAADLIGELCAAPEADVYFLTGGTQTNATVISAALKPYQGVISPDTGHINEHEAGAVEHAGHKVLALPSSQGKITAQQVQQAIDAHFNDPNHHHTVQPGMVYLSHPTECGTLYSKEELTQISRVCRQRDIPLFLDGARMGYGLTAPGNDLTLPEIARLCDVFYIGGTKVGALFGEAVVVLSPQLKRDFVYMIKQNGALLAKGRVLGIQFLALLRDGLYFEIAAHANRLAMDIRRTLEECGIPLCVDSSTNQQFPIFSNEQVATLEQKYTMTPWGSLPDGRQIRRICTSWATRDEDVQQLIADIRRL